MSQKNHPLASPADLVRLLRQYPVRWLAPTVLIATLGLFGAIFSTSTWEATQALLVRNEATGNPEVAGKFRAMEDMKAFQETILEIAKSRGVLEAALKEVGPAPWTISTSGWPSATDIDNLNDAIKISPPKGAEFGTTEVVYLKVRSRDPERAVALTDAVFDHLRIRLQELRDQKAQSILKELENARALAEADLTVATNKLNGIEKSVGSDLAELRVLHQPGSESDLRRTALELENELRQAQLAVQANNDLLTMLQAAHTNRETLLAMPNRLLESQPALRRLKDGLVDAQLRSSQVLASMSAEHPRAKAAIAAEQEVGLHLQNELNLAIAGVEADQDLLAKRQTLLDNQLKAARVRMQKLADVRAEYSNLVADVDQRTALLADARKKFTEVRAGSAGSHSSSVISRIDAPDAGTRPVGPGRAVIVLASLVGGLITGIAVLLLSVPTSGKVAAAEEPTFNAQLGPLRRRVSDRIGM